MSGKSLAYQLGFNAGNEPRSSINYRKKIKVPYASFENPKSQSKEYIRGWKAARYKNIGGFAEYVNQGGWFRESRRHRDAQIRSRKRKIAGIKYKLEFHPEVKRQTKTRNFKNTFTSKRKAENYAMSRWGSGMLSGGYIKVKKSR